MLNIMLDIETLGRRPGCKVLSIGAVVFNRNGLHLDFYVEVDRNNEYIEHLELV